MSAPNWWGDWRPILTPHTGNLQPTDLLECTSIVGGLPVNTAITGAQIIAAASGGSGLTVGTTAITSGTIGRVLFQGTGNVLQQSANLFWDNTNNRLGIGSSTPGNKLDVYGTITGASVDTIIRANGGADYVGIGINATKSGGTGQVNFFFQKNGTNVWQFGSDFAANGTKDFFIYDSTVGRNPFYVSSGGEVRIGSGSTGGTGGYWNTAPLNVKTSGNVLIGTTTDAGFKLNVNGTARVSTLNFTTNSGFLNVGGNSAVWFADPNNILRLSTSGILRFNITTTGVVTAPTLNSNLITSTTNVEANNQSIIGYQNQQLTNRNINNINKSIFLAQTTGGGSVQNAPVLRYFHALKGNVTGFTSYRGIEVEDMNSFFGTTSGSVGIGVNTSINTSAILDVTSTTQGFLPPRMTTAQKNAIASPAAGLVVYDTTLNKLCVRTASAWETITSL
jgi:hypothetical protein